MGLAVGRIGIGIGIGVGIDMILMILMICGRSVTSGLED